MTTPVVVSLRDLYLAVMARLATIPNVDHVYETEAKDVALLDHGDGLAAPYLVFHPGAGDPGIEQDLADTNVVLDWRFQVTCAAGLTEDLLELVDRTNTALYRWIPVVDGLICGQLHMPPGFQVGIQLDRQITPHRPFLPLQFTSTITAT